MIVVIGEYIDVYSTDEIDFVERYRYIQEYDDITVRRIEEAVDGVFLHNGKLFYPIEREMDVKLLL